MNFKLSLKLLVFLSFFSFSSCSDENSGDEKEVSGEPELVEHYYFEGKIDNEPFLIEKKYYDDFFDENTFLLDYGGTLINCSSEPENDIHTDCYTIYSCGILNNNNAHPEEEGKHNTAKMYFGRIVVDERIFDNELASLEKFLENNELSFRRDFGDIKKESSFAFDFFPANESFTYSTRLNDNSEYITKITSVKEIEDYFYVIEGTVENCKLYDSREANNDNQAYKILTDFKFSIKIKGDFNYNNYKDD